MGWWQDKEEELALTTEDFFAIRQVSETGKVKKAQALEKKDVVDRFKKLADFGEWEWRTGDGTRYISL